MSKSIIYMMAGLGTTGQTLKEKGYTTKAPQLGVQTLMWLKCVVPLMWGI